MTGYLNCVRFEVPLLSGAFIFFFPEKRSSLLTDLRKRLAKRRKMKLYAQKNIGKIILNAATGDKNDID
ncbi:hypothetical protein HMPREF1221_01749 [Treponema socranskii subsp. paredis ATCC 35535]|nr:hypothetical protein HMPREF1221_01749 [Treponema socranskii subsp. paredis ATCC 35535]